jgi:glutathione S-transferase
MVEPGQRKVDDALTNFRRFGAVLNKRLDGKKCVVGDALTIADLTLASSLLCARQTDAPLGEFPNIQAWFSRISDTEAWRKTNP